MIGEIRRTTGYGIRQICATLQVPRSSFYHAASPTATQSQDRRIGSLIEATTAAQSAMLLADSRGHH